MADSCGLDSFGRSRLQLLLADESEQESELELEFAGGGGGLRAASSSLASGAERGEAERDSLGELHAESLSDEEVGGMLLLLPKGNGGTRESDFNC